MRRHALTLRSLVTAAGVAFATPAVADTSGVHAGFGLHLTVDSADRGDEPPGLFASLGWLWGDTPPWYGQGDYQLVAARGWFGGPGDADDAAAIVEYARGSDHFFVGGRYGVGSGVSCHGRACGPYLGVHAIGRMPAFQMVLARFDVGAEVIDGAPAVVARVSFGIDIIGWFRIQDRSIDHHLPVAPPAKP